MFVVVTVVVVVFLLYVPACITMHSGPCSPVFSGSVDKNGSVGSSSFSSLVSVWMESVSCGVRNVEEAGGGKKLWLWFFCLE